MYYYLYALKGTGGQWNLSTSFATREAADTARDTRGSEYVVSTVRRLD